MISVIIPLYNKEKAINSTLNSVLGQSFKDIEVIVVNDGSTDQSLQVIHNNFSDERLFIYSKNNEGVSIARNYGISKSRFQYVFFLDADDVLVNNALQILYDLVVKYPDDNLFACNFSIANNSGVVIEKYCTINEELRVVDPFKYIYLNRFFVRVGNTLINKSLLNDDCLFNPELSLYEDFDFFIRLISKSSVIYSPEVILVYQIAHSELSLKVTELNKEWGYMLDPGSSSFFEFLIKMNVIYASISGRLRLRDFKGLLSLFKKFYFYLPLIFTSKAFSFLVSKFQNKFKV